MIRHFAGLTVAPERHTEHRPIFVTGRLNVTHVRVRPGEAVPEHTHTDSDPLDYVFFVVFVPARA